jgi:predicted ATP-dependent endonuclease of OLD family
MRIKKLKAGDTEIEPVNMVLIVGANGTGKTRLLDEIHAAFTGRDHKSNYWNLTFENDVGDVDKKTWHDNLHQFSEKGDIKWYCPFTKINNNHDGRKLNSSQYSQYNSETDLNFLKKELTHYLPVNERLQIPSNAPMTQQSQTASDPLNILFRSPKMLKDIQNHLKRLFSKELYLASHNVPQLELRLADSSDTNLPQAILDKPQESFQKYQEWMKANQIGEITIEGHGIQAFLHIMLSYALPTNSILMIDEPEIHLYPSIKRKFGQLLGNLAQKNKKQFICVTHDSDFLQGVFDAKCDLDILKLSKLNKTHSVIHTPYKTDSSLWAKHNQTSFLQLAFLDCGILVEGATDRLAYEHIFSDQKFLNNVEYKFISSGGKDSISNPEKIAQDLKVPYAVILDIDVLKEGEYKNVEKMLKLSGQNTILTKIRAIGPKLKGIQDFKKKGLEAISDGTTKTEVETIINDLAGLGVFVVPCGCLESWREIKCLKPEFPEKFIKSYRRKKSDFKNIIDFLKQIETYLQDKIQ